MLEYGLRVNQVRMQEVSFVSFWLLQWEILHLRLGCYLEAVAVYVSKPLSKRYLKVDFLHLGN